MKQSRSKLPLSINRCKRGRLPVGFAVFTAIGFFCMSPVPAQNQTAEAPGPSGFIKPDAPKLDQVPTPSVPPVEDGSLLKGGVEHRHNKPAPVKKKPKKAEPLNTGINGSGLSGPLKGQSDADRARALRSRLSEEAKPKPFEFKIDRSIGIIGVKFLKIAEKPPVINRVFPGTPAWNSGLQVDDVIVAVDGVPTYGLTKDQCYDLIVGTPNTPVTISVMRRGSFGAKTMTRMDFNDIPDPAVRRDYLRSL